MSISQIGYSVSEETKRKIAENESISIYQINPSNGEILNRFSSATLAGKELNICSSNITACCKAKRKLAGGFIWKYEKEGA